ncbi:MAG: GTPase Era [Legionellales bacterium]|nr:GTPase Era [Legionellales bacterium]|tara:strand:- start:221 stop:1066 length:846 start_codon:yes stop_codon:yes gene_type:complete
MKQYCGKVCIIGRPNVGKSTFLNQAIGEKISIVTHKAQTTRRQIKGIYSNESHQIIFIDTPGINSISAKSQVRSLNKIALTALIDIDLVIFIVDRDRWLPEDEWILEAIKTYQGPCVAVINKIDQMKSDSMLALLETVRDKQVFQAVMPISALKGQHIQLLLDHIKLYMPEKPFMYPIDSKYDINEQFLVKEVIREKLLIFTHEEIPFISNINIEEWIKTDKRFSVSIVIHVNTIGQKKIIIGHNGQQLKRIGRQARLDIEQTLGQKMHLNIWIKIKKRRV